MAVTIRQIIPNTLTFGAVVFGMTAVILCIEGKYHLTGLCIIFSAMLDAIDGWVARAINGATKFGEELDSLADYVNFGVVPALVLYFWIMKEWGLFGWVLCLIYSICVGCRLARFNSGGDFNTDSRFRHYFMGVPAPGCACLVCAPLAFSFNGFQLFQQPVVVGAFLLIVSFLAVSSFPTYSSKLLTKERITRTKFNMVSFVTIFTALVIGGLIDFWYTCVVCFFLYFATFPFSYRSFRIETYQIKEDRKS